MPTLTQNQFMALLYVALTVLAVLGTHFFGVPSEAVTQALVTFLIGHLFGYITPSDSKPVTPIIIDNTNKEPVAPQTDATKGV